MVVVGSLNLDLVVSLARLPEPGETVFGDRLEQHAGGKGLNQAAAAARMGAHVSMIGALGTDGAADWLRDVVDAEGIERAGIMTVDGPSGTALIEVDVRGGNRIVVVSGANAHVTPEHVRASMERIDDIRVVLTQGEVPIASVATALQIGRARGATTIYNPAPVTDLPEGMLADCDVVVPNEHEAALLTGLPTETSADATDAARRLVDRGAACVIVTRSHRGTVWATRSSTGSSGAFSVRTIDTVAAGDAFCGGLATAMAEGKGLGEALRWASAAGALATTVAGAVPSLPSREDVEQLVG